MKLDIVGDVHGQHEKLVDLLEKLGYGDDGGACIAPAAQYRYTDRTMYI